MDRFFDKRRKVTGHHQLKPNERLMDSPTYARNHHYSIAQVSRLCRQKKLRAYKVAGKWHIVVKSAP